MKVFHERSKVLPPVSDNQDKSDSHANRHSITTLISDSYSAYARQAKMPSGTDHEASERLQHDVRQSPVERLFQRGGEGLSAVGERLQGEGQGAVGGEAAGRDRCGG